MFETSPFMYGVLIAGGVVCIAIGIAAGLNAAWKSREAKDGKK